MTAISSLRNLGPAMEAAFTAAGVPDAETLRALGTDAAYAMLLASGTKPHFIGYYVIEMALQGRPWNDCKGKEKAQLRVRFEGLVKANARSTKGAPPGIEAELDRIGVIPRERMART